MIPGAFAGPLHDETPSAPPLEAPALPQTGEFDELRDEDIADRVTDFALGLRNDIA